MSYLLFCLRSGNVMSEFASEREAWDSLLGWVHDEGLEAIADLSLLRMRDGQPTMIAMETELVRRVTLEVSPETVSRESRR